jgi:mRNA interferase RelE/StbE
MSRYALDFRPGVKEAIERAPGTVRQRLWQTVKALQDDPYPPAAKEMEDDDQGLWRIRVDDWRIVYAVDDEILIVEIVRVGRKSGPDRGPNFYDNLRSQG